MSQSIASWFQTNGSRIANRWRDRNGDAGTALVEVALLVSVFFVPLIFGTTDIGTLIYDSMEISDAAHAGAMAGAPSSVQAANTSAITAAAKADASDFPAANLSVTPTVYYACNTTQGGAQFSTQSAANIACTSPAYPLEFVKVVVSAPVTLPFRCCGLPTAITSSSTSVMQVAGQP